ncbi:MAG: DUF1841 family protein [Rhodocyclaceae bacterium]
MFDPSREQARTFFIEAWRKHAGRIPRSPIEDIALGIVIEHPEYHALLEDPEAIRRDYTPEGGQANPFLHLALHLAIEEQLSIDQPAGIRAAFDALAARLGDRHEALHRLLECLGETIWRSQREAAPPDGAAYLDCVRRALG